MDHLLSHQDQQGSSLAVPSESVERLGNSELELFRKNWLDEVRRQNQQPHENYQQFNDGQPSHHALNLTKKSEESYKKEIFNPLEAGPSNSKSVNQDPLTLYAHAVYYERTGLLDDALLCYRKALRLDPMIDKAYHLLKPNEIEAIERQFNLNYCIGNESWSEFRFSRTLESQENYYPMTQLETPNADANHPSSTAKLLKELLKSFINNPWKRNQQSRDDKDESEADLLNITSVELEDNNEPEEDRKATDQESLSMKFEISDLNLPCPISKIPPELLLLILANPSIDRSKLHLTTNLVERFARVSRLGRILTLDQSLWRLICEKTYLTDLFINQTSETDLLPHIALIENLCLEYHGNDWRRMYIEQPRIRFEGCFIAVARYSRLGESANPWYTPTHFVTFFRYLRMFPDGTCLTVASTDEPSAVVRKLQAPTQPFTSETQVVKGLKYGQWSLKDDFLRIYNLKSDFGHSEQDNRNNSGQMKYRLEMHCKLESTRRGKMNKLQLYKIMTLNLNTGEELDIPLPPVESGSKPFIFSRVVAYDQV
ncbi:hypothetical protein BY996DRAFT_4580607 [Phakopsora pachyrhizi]|nr:hypothetical protein BY996DRAFT_4580607 [Phakopsora pachyrhizi]